MIPLAIPNLTGNEREYLNRCIDTTFVSSVGEFVNQLEQMSASICGTEYAVATSSGTTGLHTALLSVGVQRDDLVIIPDYTFIATANAVSHCGAVPWLVDINRESWTIDAEILEQALLEETERKEDKLIHKKTRRKVAAIMPVYTLGNIPDMDEIQRIAVRHGLPIVADAACAIGAEYKGRKIGELADVSVLSFNGNKTVTAGGGGAIVGNDKSLIDLAKHLSTTARRTSEYDFDMVGYNYRMTNVQAAVGCAQLERTSEFVEKKRKIRKYYEDAFSDIPGISMFPVPENNKSACWFSGIVLDDGDMDKIRFLCSALRKEGIEARSFWKPIHMQEPYKNCPVYGNTQIADNLWDKILTLPCSTNIAETELAYVVDAVKSKMR